MALPAKIVEVALAKTTEVRKRLLEMAMPAVQRARLERLDTFDIVAGSGSLPSPSPRSSSESAGASSSRDARHGDEDQTRQCCGRG